MVRNPATHLYNDTTQCENLFVEKKIIKKLKITKQSHAFKGYANTYNVEILNSFNPVLQLNDTKSAIQIKLIIYLLTELKGFKFVIILFLVFKKIESDNKTLYSTFCLDSKAEAIITESDIGDVIESSYRTVISNIQKSL